MPAPDSIFPQTSLILYILNNTVALQMNYFQMDYFSGLKDLYIPKCICIPKTCMHFSNMPLGKLYTPAYHVSQKIPTHCAMGCSSGFQGALNMLNVEQTVT
jgi:hypothetical protein